MRRAFWAKLAVVIAAVLLFEIPLSYATLIDDDAPVDVGATSIDSVTLTSDAELDLLYDERAQAVLDNDEQLVLQVEEKMKNAGIHFLSDSEVDDLTRKLPQDQTQDFVILPAVSAPSQKNISWTSTRKTITYKKKKYEVQTLTAQPKANYDSNLRYTGSAIVKDKSNLIAGAANIIKTAVSAGASVNLYGNIAVTLLQAIQGAVSGASKTTVVTEANINYAWTATQTVQFKCVKLSGKKDSSQRITFICSKANIVIGTQFSRFVTKNSRATPSIIQNRYAQTVTPKDYDSNTLAARAFAENKFFTSDIGSYKVSGLSDKKVFSIWFTAPTLLTHVY